MHTLEDFNLSLSEHRFWLQIMGDHSRFIYYSLGPTESEYIMLSQEFITLFDQLLEEFRGQLPHLDMDNLNPRSYETTYRFRDFLVNLLSKSLTQELRSQLSPSLFNVFLNEVDEYLYIINMMMNQQKILFHPLHYHMLWLPTAVNHASLLVSSFDPTEQDLISSAKNLELEFKQLHAKALTTNGFLRCGLDSFPALDRLNDLSVMTTNRFREYLDNIRDQRMDYKILGTLYPLLADHMYREECYYLQKLFLSTDSSRRPDCDPSSPRSIT